MTSSSNVPIEVLGFSVRTYNCLKRARKHTVDQLLAATDRDLLKIQQLGPRALAEIRQKLAQHIAERSDIIPPEPVAEDRVLSPVRGQRIAETFPPAPSSLEVLKLSTRSIEILRRARCQTVNDVAALIAGGARWSPGDLDQERLTEVRGQLGAFFGRHPYLARPAPLRALGLSVRPYNALMRHGVYSVEKLTQLSDEELCGVRNIGVKSVDEITDKLSAYLETHPGGAQPEVLSGEATPLPPSSSLLVDPDELAVLQQRDIPLDDITVERIALSELDLRLLREAGIRSIKDLAQQPRGQWGRQEHIGRELTRYLEWLVEQDEVRWLDEVLRRDISPLFRLDLASRSLEDLVQEWLSPLDERGRQIIEWRYNLYGEGLTLEEAGERFRTTRERARQIQNKAIRKLQLPQHCSAIYPLCALLTHLLEQAGGLLNSEQLGTALRRELTIGDVNPVGVAHLVLASSDDVKWIRAAKSWGLKGLPLDLVPTVQEHMVTVLKRICMQLAVETVVSQFKETRYYRNHRDELDEPFLIACLKTHPQIEMDEGGLCGLKRSGKRKLYAVVLALRQIGKPAHYSLIAEQTNALLPPDQRTSARNIQALLDRRSLVFVSLGRGKYWLRNLESTDTDTQPRVDFGDLFGARLSRWQEELDRRQGDSEFDMHAEVDRIRDVGLDFFAD